MRVTRRAATQPLQPPMVPMISLMFQLLLFFVLMPSNQSDGYLTTNLPKTEGPVKGLQPIIEKRIKLEIFVLNDDPRGENIEICLNENQYLGTNFDALRDGLIELRARGMGEYPVLISPMMATQHKWVVKAFDAAVAARFTNIQFAVPYDDSPNQR
jgi:biopolymer transport protein ExbD